MEYLTLILKPEVKRLLEQPWDQREEFWMEKLAAATFDVADYRNITADQRRAAKTLFYAYAYSATPIKLVDMFSELSGSMSKASQTMAELAAVYQAGQRDLLSPTDAKDVRVGKNGNTWPKAKGTY